ncbi:sulfur carrier protein ThiS [Sodalis-like secondary symbiont of Drepanosiphum platanoidis]|uniref:sulfur carrier protein ThiS n=1 Tax=Sodalis-like secondary symbiont of Drepanosiphum platanoidis TaxID=2994493 RepID=UPI003463F6B8
MSQIEIVFNTKKIKLKKSIKLDIFLKNYYKDFKGMALSVNKNIIPLQKWNKYLLKDKDNIYLFEAISGG